MTTPAYPGPNVSTGNGVTTVFPYSYPILRAADLKVTVDGVVQTLTTHYAVSGVGESAGGNVTFVTAPANGLEVVLSRARAYTRVDTDYQRNGSFDEETVDADFDALMHLIQQLNAAGLRTIKAPESVSADQVISSADWAIRASKFLGFDSLGALTLLAIADVAPTAISAFISTLVDDPTAAAARTTLGAADASTVALKGANSDITALTALTSGTPFRKNAIINGDFQVWQEGTSFAAMANGQYVADNWQYQKVGAMVHTGSRSTDVPTIVQAGRKIPYSILIDCTTVDAAIAAGDLTQLITFVEGYNFVNIAGVGLCHQFWHKHTKVGTYCAAYRNAGVDRSFVREYTQAVSDTWELATVLVEASPPAGTWDYTNGIGMYVSFTLAAGTTYQTLAGAWQTGNFFATANQVNACDSVANNFMLAGVQLEKGSVATEFDVRTFADELALCQRYYEKTFDYSVAPVNASGSYVGALISVVPINDTLMYFTFDFKAEKRTNPTIVTYNPTQANNLARTWANTGDSVGITGNGAAGLGRFGFYSGSGAAQNPYAIHATANARF